MRTGFLYLMAVMTTVPAWGAEVPPFARLETAYSGDTWRNASGGIATGNRYLDNLDITLELNAGSAAGFENVRFFGYVLHNQGDVLSDELTGSVQGVSNIETSRALRLYELWMEWEMSRVPGSFRAGLYDLNAEFDSIGTAGVFVNPSSGIGPDFAQSGENGPSIFPNTSLALRYAFERGPWTLQAAVLDAIPGDPEHPDRSALHLAQDDGLLMVGEINRHSGSGFRIGAGYWHYTEAFDDLVAITPDGDPARRSDNSGFYAILETPQFFAGDPERGVRFYARAGDAEANINPVAHYYGFGGVYTGLLPGRSKDQLGLAFSIAELGAPCKELMASEGLQAENFETIVELTYRFEVFDWLALQPDVQYIRHPGMDPGLDDAWLFGLRFEVSQGWAW